MQRIVQVTRVIEFDNLDLLSHDKRDENPVQTWHDVKEAITTSINARDSPGNSAQTATTTLSHGFQLVKTMTHTLSTVYSVIYIHHQAMISNDSLCIFP
jgi:hypothetical protein